MYTLISAMYVLPREYSELGTNKTLKAFFCLQTYIGNVLISVNPYKNLPIYTEEKIKQYYKKAFFEAPPHV